MGKGINKIAVFPGYRGTIEERAFKKQRRKAGDLQRGARPQPGNTAQFTKIFVNGSASQISSEDKINTLTPSWLYPKKDACRFVMTGAPGTTGSIPNLLLAKSSPGSIGGCKSNCRKYRYFDDFATAVLFYNEKPGLIYLEDSS